MSDAIDGLKSGSITPHHEVKNPVKEETKKKLEALGIDPSTVKTETEAQQKIKEAESAQANAANQVHTVKQGHEANPMQQVFTDAKKLAEKVGLVITDIKNIDDVFKNLDKTISGFEKEARNDVDNDRRAMTSSVRQEYEKIHSQYLSAKADEAKITGNLDLLAAYNKVRT